MGGYPGVISGAEQTPLMPFPGVSATGPSPAGTGPPTAARPGISACLHRMAFLNGESGQ